MKRISAEGNLSIAVSSDRWQLIEHGDEDEQVVLEAETGTPLHYTSGFATSRHLPESGTLPTESILYVVLGWSESDSHWQLGLMLHPTLAEERGGRWCKLARWHDPSSSAIRADATEAGEALAQVTGLPFHLIAPENTPDDSLLEPTPEPEPVIPPVPLIPLPIRADIWTLSHANADSLSLDLGKQWANATLRQILWHIFWVLVYIALLYGAYTAGIAPVQPEFLPYLAIFSAVVLVLLIIRNGYRLFTHINRILFAESSATGQHNESPRWTEPADDVKAVYVSHVFSSGDVRKGKVDALPQYSELNLLLHDESFRFLLAYEETKETVNLSQAPIDGIHPLISNDAQTNLQWIALHIAETLNVPCYYDFRSR